MEYVAKVKRLLLYNSKFNAARRLVNDDRGYKYLTQNQVEQVSRYGIEVEYLKSDERINLNQPKLKKDRNKETKITFKDEDGEHTITFKSQKEANEWIRFQESCTQEKFELINVE